MSNRRKFIKDLSLSSASIAIGVNNKNKILPFDFLKNINGPFMATGIKLGEVSSTAAIIWTRLTESPVKVSDDVPQPTILYKNPTTGEFEHKEGKETRPNREPKIIYPHGIDVNTIAGAVPGTAGELRVLWKAGNAWKESVWQHGDRHWQYASKDTETGLLEFGCGPISNEHAGGWNQGDK